MNDEFRMTNDQAPMTNRKRMYYRFGHWSLVIGHYLSDRHE